jgi:Protein of unknown function (DUF3027)
MNGASTANGAMVMIRNSTTRPRAWSTDVLKKIDPASATVTNASAAPLTAVISISVPSPVLSAPCAPVTRCTSLAVRRVALAEAWPPKRKARPVAWAALPARRTASFIRMYTVFLVRGTTTSPIGEILAGRPSRCDARERELAVVSTIRNRAKEPDQVCADAVDLARQSLAEQAGVAGGTIGDHLGVEASGDRVVTHFFECTDRAYTGWRWAVTVARAPRAKVVTVDESVLLPGPEALLAPAWVPWQDRLRPGDVGIGDLLPASPDDERLVPFVVLDGDDAVTDWFQPRTDAEDLDAGPRIAEEIPSPARSRVLSAFGRDDTAERWYESDHGPRTPLSHAAPANCTSCGFFVPLSGSLGRVFGACGNAFAPDDGRVVSADHGCGAHSEAVLTGPASQATAPVIDEFGYDLVDLPGVSVEETVFEPLSRDTYPEES